MVQHKITYVMTSYRARERVTEAEMSTGYKISLVYEQREKLSDALPRREGSASKVTAMPQGFFGIK